MTDFTRCCFACGCEVDINTVKINAEVNLPVCDNCSETEREKQAIAGLREGMADGFVCGCI